MVNSLKDCAKHNSDFKWELWDICKNIVNDVEDAATFFVKKLN